MADTHNVNAALYTILVNNGIKESKKVTINSKKNKIEFKDQADRKITMDVKINRKEYVLHIHRSNKPRKSPFPY